METRMIVCGGVDFNDYGFFKSQMDRLITYYENIRLVSGHARGADTFAEQYAAENGIQIQVFPAEWKSTAKQLDRFVIVRCWSTQRKRHLWLQHFGTEGVGEREIC